MFDLQTRNLGLTHLDEQELMEINGGGPTTFVTIAVLVVAAIAGLFTGCQEEKRKVENNNMAA